MTTHEPLCLCLICVPPGHRRDKRTGAVYELSKRQQIVKKSILKKVARQVCVGCGIPWTGRSRDLDGRFSSGKPSLYCHACTRKRKDRAFSTDRQIDAFVNHIHHKERE